MNGFRFPKKKYIKSVTEYHQNIIYTINVIRYSSSLFKTFRNKKIALEPRRLDLIINHSLRDLQMIFGWDSKGSNGNYRKCYLYLSKDIYRETISQPNVKNRNHFRNAKVEHIVPVKYGVDQLKSRLLNDEEVKDTEFLKVIFGPVGLITKDEDKKLTQCGFVAKMPNPKFPLSRYSATEISLFNALDGKEIIKTDYSWLKHFETLSKLPLPLTNGEILEDLFKKFIKNGEDWKDLFK